MSGYFLVCVDDPENTSISALKAVFPVENDGTKSIALAVPPSYVSLCELLQLPKGKLQQNSLLAGNSGIGKSNFILFAVWWLIMKGKSVVVRNY